MQILLIMLIVVLLAFLVLLLALAKQSPREKQTEDKEQEEYIRDYAETVRQTGGSMKKLEHWKVIAIYLIIYDMIAVNFSYFMALLVRFDFRYSSIPTDYFAAWRSFAPIYTIIILVVFGCMHLYNSVWRFASFHELIKITVATVITGVLHIAGITIFWGRMPASYYLIGVMLQFFLTVGVRFSYRFVLLERNRREKSEREERSKNVMIIGAGEAGRTIVRELQNAKETNSRVRCLIDDNPNKWGRYMEGVPVVGGRDDIFLNVDKYHINQILLAIPTATPHQKRDILNICKETGCELKQLPGVYQLVNGEVSLSKMKKVAVEDLLGRDTIQVNMSEIFQYLKGKRILVTGGGGSIGSELCRQIAGHEPELLVIFDIYENNAYDIEQELKASYPNLNLKVLIGSVRDSKRINWVFETYKPEIVYHAAAHKHVPLMEYNPTEAIKNNINGTKNVAEAAKKNHVKNFVMISSDKANRPPNVMGATKRIAEMLITSLNQSGETKFSAVRFGNVLGSRGSVIPLFKEQILRGGPITVTDFRMTRYFMTIPEASRLVIQSGALAKGGEIFVLDMDKPIKIVDLAKNMIHLSGYTEEDIEIVETGIRPGEKLYEELLLEKEKKETQIFEKIFVGDIKGFSLKEVTQLIEQLPEDESEAAKKVIAFANASNE